MVCCVLSCFLPLLPSIAAKHHSTFISLFSSYCRVFGTGQITEIKIRTEMFCCFSMRLPDAATNIKEDGDVQNKRSSVNYLS